MQLVKSGQLNLILLFFMPFHCTLTVRTTGHYVYSVLKERLISTVIPRSEVSYSSMFGVWFFWFCFSPTPIQGKRQSCDSVTVQVSSSRRSKPSMLIHQINVSRVSGIHYLYLILTEQGSWSWSPEKLTEPVFIVFLKQTALEGP